MEPIFTDSNRPELAEYDFCGNDYLTDYDEPCCYGSEDNPQDFCRSCRQIYHAELSEDSYLVDEVCDGREGSIILAMRTFKRKHIALARVICLVQDIPWDDPPMPDPF